MLHELNKKVSTTVKVIILLVSGSKNISKTVYIRSLMEIFCAHEFTKYIPFVVLKLQLLWFNCINSNNIYKSSLKTINKQLFKQDKYNK